MTARIRRGFTLIELLIVIAIIGVLAVVILVAINPQEQLARTRDAGRTSSVTQLGHAFQAYGTSHEGDYVTENNTWVTSMVTAGEIATAPGALAYSITGTAACSAAGRGIQNGYCYDGDGATPPNNGIIYSRLESGSNNSRCTAPAVAWVVFDTVLGRGGL